MRRVPIPFIGLIVCFGLTIYAPAAENSFNIRQVMSAPFASELIAAPSGARVAWLMNEQGRRNIWAASAPDWRGRRATAFNQDDGQDISELAWPPDGSYLLFARGGDFETGGDNPNPNLSPEKPEQTIWVVAMDGSGAKKLSEGHAPAVSPVGDAVAFLRGGQIWMMTPSGKDVRNVVTQKVTASDLQWSPDGLMLAFVSHRQDHSLIGIYTPADKSLRYLDASVDGDQNPVWSATGAQIAYLRIPTTAGEVFSQVRRAGQPWSIRVTDMKTGVAHEAFRAQPGTGSLFRGIEASHQIFWAAGDRLVFPWERTGWCHLYSVAASGGASTELTRGDGEVEHVAISRDGKRLFYSTNIGDIDRRHIWSVDLSGTDQAKSVTSGEQIEWAPVLAADGSALAFLASSYNERAHTMIQTANAEPKALARESTPADFPAAALVKPQPVLITAADGLQIHGQLFLPKDDSVSRHPVLVFFHGGSRRQMLLGFHYMDYYSNAYALNQYFANCGYVVLSVNYRSGIGYGLNFREAVNFGPWGASEFNDVIGAGLYLKSRADVDPKRIGVWGGSYGGYLTALALSRASDLFAAGVDFHGVHDWSKLRDEPGSPDAPGDPKQIRALQEAARVAFESSPMASVDTWRSPVLLIHGDDDRNVPFPQTVMLVEALRQRNVPFEELIIPNEIHGFLMHRHWLEAYQATAEFFARRFATASEPVSNAQVSH